jgi:general secretion pathway protein A
MQKTFYQARNSPFAPTADPKYLFLSHGHREARASVTHGLQRRSGVVVLLGEAGTGKTTLIRHVLEWFGTNTKTAFILSPPVSFEELLLVVFQDLQLPWQGWRHDETIDTLSNYLCGERAGRRDVVIVIDEAQHLSAAVLEGIQSLSNLEIAGDRLLQIILVGQPELRAKLALPSLVPLGQRIGLMAELAPLSYRETVGYISHRLKIAGHRGGSPFTRPALRKIYRVSGGNPRVVNAICDMCLERVRGAGAPRINARIVKAVVKDEWWAVGKDAATSPAGVRRPRSTRDGRMRARRPLGWVTGGLLLAVISGMLLLLARPRDGGVVPSRSGPLLETASPEPHPPAETVREGAGSARETAASVATARPSETPVVPVPGPPPPAASELAGDPPRSRVPPNVPEVIVKPGDTIASLVMGVYGRVDYTLLDVVKMANPEVGDLNSIRVGQRLRFPRFEPSVMVQRKTDGLYMVHLLTVWDTSSEEFAQLREAVRKEGRTISVTPLRLTEDSSPSQFRDYPKVYRVMVGDFPDRDEAERFYRRFQGRADALR